MNKIAKYAFSLLLIVIVSYIAWIVIKTTFPVDEWFDQNPTWRSIFILLIIIGIIGIISAIIKPRGKWN
jgi:hypothetical protein